ncbi:MAG: bifunctional diaminohydroxyphosphoribosylaminopyrimidine deaminase/5-amino-6-(5-phosphoribosylamino)uracil reductase RibD [Rhodovarius sp.]|nr:bifunctional diaminohydroxyphosphoribosylaminopyrimidine deaminase/5-amino-6-(5-phosphoribosylamino)uracil reductase RibD [Rhodovarius sp.]MCX7933223.1 bifunctional diaminohydroxyphosphoribosylaminopyrimidine deaminase/5-amino-6-(5-phosphoribosylamino)uracil reductase RibD [Rhodovarius sp.]MDW8315259.1 bifunctional diaminohydroxyphosphoribosylaminopyrimidine deaminase/5-amino-6-(5-phosphoribosylamino)uracil reductase RibD [Rhodovarius sp.]
MSAQPGSGSDVEHMRAALALAARALGNAWPNPAVGCVLVRDGMVVGRGWTQPGGRPHAEAEALRRAGPAARGATAYVTLEPCSHWGRTPPCCDALIAAGLARVVVAMRDPDPRVDGRGLARLRAAGIAVEEGLLEEEARRLQQGFLRRITLGLPMVTLKLATTLDGRIATAGGESRWITGEAARRAVHAARARHDAVLVGSGTVLADDPLLTVRGLGLPSPPRVVWDARLRLPLASRLVATAREVPLWLLTAPGHPPARLAPYLAAGVEVITAPPAVAGGGLDPRAALQALAARGITRILCEGGGRLAAALLRERLVQRLLWFHAPATLGAEGLPAIGALGLPDLAAMPRFRPLDSRPLPPDMLTEFEEIT